MESRIRREVSVRFGRGKVETYRSNPARRNQPTSYSYSTSCATKQMMNTAGGFPSMYGAYLMNLRISGKSPNLRN